MKTSAAPDGLNNLVIYDITYLIPIYTEKAIHHEFYHLIEYNHYGTFYNQEEAWLNLNPSGFEYFSSGKDAHSDPNFKNTEHPREGFVTYYSLYAIEEDRAETFSYLMSSEGYRKLQNWVTLDPIIKLKVENLKKFIAEKSSLMDSNYFDCVNEF